MKQVFTVLLQVLIPDFVKLNVQIQAIFQVETPLLIIIDNVSLAYIKITREYMVIFFI